MIMDSSALIAVLREEPEGLSFMRIIDHSPACCISAANFVETAVVLDSGRDPVISRRLEEFLSTAGIAIEPVTEQQAHIAREAYRDFGKSSGHPAKLNFGDCFAYALAKDKGEPLLFKGRDFAQTDIAPAVRY